MKKEIMLKIWNSGVSDEETSDEPGTVTATANDNITVQTGRGSLVITEVQLEGKKRMSTGEFLRGFRLEKGIRLNGGQ